jgi:hypothetical protein
MAINAQMLNAQQHARASTRRSQTRLQGGAAPLFTSQLAKRACHELRDRARLRLGPLFKGAKLGEKAGGQQCLLLKGGSWLHKHNWLERYWL